MARSKTNIPAKKPWMLPPRELADIMAIRAIATGTANESQQKRAWDYLLREVCGNPYSAYDPDSIRDTDFMLGRQFVGHTLVKFATQPVDILVKQETGK